MEGKVVAEWISPERVDDTGGEKMMQAFAGVGLLCLAGAIAAMAFFMHFLPGA